MRILTRQNQARIGAALVSAVVLAGLGTSVPATADEPAATTADVASDAYLAPYYTQGDLDGDGTIDQTDLDQLVAALGTTSSDSGWAAVSAADYDDDSTITLTDVSELSQRIIYDDGPFSLVEASALDMQKAMNAGVTTSHAITQAYLDRIAAYDKTVVDTSTGGRALNSIISVNPDALELADAADAKRAAGEATSMLEGIPVILKDNYDTTDMPTTGGCGCWDDNLTSDDATMVTDLRSAGAIILAKASLDEFAYGFVSEYSSFQAAGSTTLVASPYVTSRTAGGSSGGTGASIAANLGAIGFGTDTGGSIRVPSSYNQLVGVRPTVGLTSRDGIIPLALSQDTGGPIARSVSDAAIALDAVAGVDPADPATAAAAGKIPESYTSYLDPKALQGKRIGYLASMVSTNATTVRLFNQAKADLEAQGATVVEISIDGVSTVLNEGSGSTNEFKHDLSSYITNHLAPQVTNRSISDILASGRFVTSRTSTYVQRNNVTEEQYQAWAGPTGSHTTAIANGATLVTQAMDDDDLDAIIYPSGTPYSTYSTNMRLSPNTGMPAVTVPMGQATADDGTSAIVGAGVNLEFLGRKFAEGPLLGIAYSYEQATEHRTTPSLYPALDQ